MMIIFNSQIIHWVSNKISEIERADDLMNLPIYIYIKGVFQQNFSNYSVAAVYSSECKCNKRTNKKIIIESSHLIFLLTFYMPCT